MHTPRPIPVPSTPAASRARIRCGTNKYGSTLLHGAAYHGAEVLRLPLAGGANPNTNNINGNTPLHRSACYNNADGVAQLLAAGSDPNQRDSDGATALHEAVFWGHVEVVALLLQGGAIVDMQDDKGSTVFDVARAEEQTRILFMRPGRRERGASETSRPSLTERPLRPPRR